MRRLSPWLGIFLAALSGQEIDTVGFSRERKPFTVLDQIENAQERNAFLRLYGARQARERRRLAESFLEAYPQSWLRGQACEIAAKAAIDLEDAPAALRWGRESLRLLPENPLLLVPLSNLEAQVGQFAGAARDARRALEYLARFAHPASIAEKDWPAVRRSLEASAEYALGRVDVTEGLAASGEDQRRRLRAAVDHLSRARSRNPDDPEIAYLLGLAQLSLGDRAAAAAEFQSVAKQPGPLQARAAERLRGLPAVTAVARPAANFDPAPGPSARPAGYAGSQSCRACHAGQYTAWEQTGMARMFQPYRPENVIGDFSQAGTDPGVRVWTEKGRHFFGARGGDGQWRHYPVDYTIGSKWQQAYATRLPSGQIHVFPLQYNAIERGWVNYWRMIDPPNSPRGDLGGFHQMRLATSYQMNCAPCHTSQLGADKPGGFEPQDLVFREAGVNCEMCHGPSAAHAAAMRAGQPGAKTPAAAPVDFQRIGNRQFVAICGQCHMQSAMRDPGALANDVDASGAFFPRYLARPFTEFSQRAFYKDGRFRETTFIVEAFQRSACYERGQAHCGHCHDPHPAGAAANPTSLKYREDPDRMCLQCHTGYAAAPARHTRHAASSEASRCVSCHMPRIMNSLLFQARSHQIDDIPDGAMTLRFGQGESPNACLNCHRDKEPSWAALPSRAPK
ncbi:MAG: hypothetical protein HY013_07610 [Candidatus Solibacter usitatus]|nr:hypothetical protein [Candidatus Solibacter usitatus]